MNDLRKKEGKKRFPLIGVIAAAVFVSCGLSFFLGQSGVIRLRQLRFEYDRMLRENYQLAMENKSMADDIRKLRHDPAAVEKVAREELHFVSPHDVVLVVPQK